ncbi:hypothetical protein AMECASPLE_012075 [Ameca splendens]|uniref:Uncharacterized protein n=1 Tax=Ameca splendens TaxID=208324 RepID=A0ABV0YNG4_9TELE
MADFLWGLHNGSRDFFVGCEKLRMYTKFHKPRTKHALGLVVLMLLEDAVEQLGHAYQSFHWISVGGWTNINPIEFGAYRIKNVEIRSKRNALAESRACRAVTATPSSRNC